MNVHLWTEKAPREKSKKEMLRVVLLRQNKMANGLMGEWLQVVAKHSNFLQKTKTSLWAKEVTSH